MRVATFLLLTAMACNTTDSHNESQSSGMGSNLPKVQFSGAMSDVMHKGAFQATIDFDTLSSFDNLFALGPLEGLKGEFLVVNGTPYVSNVIGGSCVVSERKSIRAPFTAYSAIEQWESVALPNDIRTISALNSFFDQQFMDIEEPFFFQIQCMVDSARIHVMNLPDSVQVTSPEVAHRHGRKFFEVVNKKATLIGVYSRHHHGVFTHHDSNTHIHLITSDGKTMGHLDGLLLNNGNATLKLPAQLNMPPSQPV